MKSQMFSIREQSQKSLITSAEDEEEDVQIVSGTHMLEESYQLQRLIQEKDALIDQL